MQIEEFKQLLKEYSKASYSEGFHNNEPMASNDYGALASVVKSQILQAFKDLQEELETERMRLAACGVVALANTRKTAKEVRKCNKKYYSAPMLDVMKMVDREIKYREALEEIANWDCADLEDFEYLKEEIVKKTLGDK